MSLIEKRGRAAVLPNRKGWPHRLDSAQPRGAQRDARRDVREQGPDDGADEVDRVICPVARPMETKLHAVEVVVVVSVVEHILAHIYTPVQGEHCPHVVEPVADLRILSGPCVRRNQPLLIF
jgi:hypothetical protein